MKYLKHKGTVFDFDNNQDQSSRVFSFHKSNYKNMQIYKIIL